MTEIESFQEEKIVANVINATVPTDYFVNCFVNYCKFGNCTLQHQSPIQLIPLNVSQSQEAAPPFIRHCLAAWPAVPLVRSKYARGRADRAATIPQHLGRASQ
jgi:hypothetical protein